MKINNRSAFTLLEVLIAGAISAVVIVGAYSAFHTGMLSYRKIESALLPYQTARNILGRIERELRNSFIYRPDDTGFKGQKNNLSFFAILDAYEEGNLVTDVYRLRYSADSGILERSAFAGTEAFKEEAGATGASSLYKIRGIVFEYAAPRSGSDKGYDWQAAWPKDDSQKNLIPLAVRIKLSLAAGGNQEAPVDFTRIIGLPLS